MQNQYITNRLQLDALALQDSHFILELTNTKEWLQFIGDRNLKTVGDAAEYIQKILNNPNAQYWIVKLQEGLTPIGAITVIKRDYLDDKDLGFAFLPQYGKQGFAYEAANAILRDLANTEKNIVAITLRENVNSVHLLEKLGFNFEREVENSGEVLALHAVSSDTVLINDLTQQFFNIFTNTHDRKPDWDRIYTLCIPQALIIKKTGLQQEVYTLDTFIAPRKIMLSDGTLTDFEEREISHNTLIKGNIAQRYSKFSKSGVLRGERFRQQGHKLFQFIKTDVGWRISAVVWEDDTAE